MQNNPPLNNDPGLSAQGKSDIPFTAHPENENTGVYGEPEYKEYSSPGPNRPAPPQANRPAPARSDSPPVPPIAPQGNSYPPAPQQGYLPPTPRPQQSYIPSTPQQGYPQPQQNYIPSTPQPGYLPPTPQPGYIPPTPQPGYVPFPPQNGYVSQPGYTGQIQPLPPRKKPSALAIGGAVLAVIIIVSAAIAVFAALNRSSGTASATPTVISKTQGTPTAVLGKTTSAFQTASCPFTVGAGLTEGQQIICGYVTAPENHTTNDGKTVKLAVTIFKAPQYMNTVDPDPVIRLEGGPGGSSLEGWAPFVTESDYSQLIFDHDVVMFDQRGTGYSTPSLNCPETQSLQASTTDVSATTYEKAVQACYTRLVGQGINLSDFNTIENADDVSDIIHALGYQQMTIYGVSYGTRLALTVMRVHPEVVHASIIDSVYPLNHTRTELPDNAQRVFTVLFQGCAKDPSCNSKYPNLQTVFYKLVDTLNAQPGSFNVTDPTTGTTYKNVELSGDDLVSWLFSALYATSFIPALPQTIYQVLNHQYEQFAEMYGELEYDTTSSDGLFYSVECGEDWPFLTQQDISQTDQGVDPHIVKVFATEDEEEEYTICQSWKVQTVPAVQKQPVVSSLPTLVLAGEYDPITPYTDAQDAAKTLSHSYYFLFPGQGHGQQYSSSCSDQIIQAFEDNAAQAPSSSCISQMTEPAFL